jgi:drug/metabolite transporter (DMT)-like permease
LRGTSLVLVAALSTACMGVFIKEALARGSDPQALMTVRYVIVGVLLGLPLLIRRSLPASRSARRRALAVGVCMFFGGSFEIRALSVLPLGVVVVILFLSPLWIALYSRLVRGERLGFVRQLSFVLVFTGIVCLVGPALGRYDVGGLFFALGSSFLWAAILLGIQDPDAWEGYSPSIAIASAAAAAAVLAVVVQPLALSGEFGHPDRVPWLLATGASAALGFGLLGLGMRGQHVFDVAVVSATEPPFAVLLGAVILGERLSAVQLLGVVLVAVGVALIASTYQDPEDTNSAASPVDCDQGRAPVLQRGLQRLG